MLGLSWGLDILADPLIIIYFALCCPMFCLRGIERVFKGLIERIDRSVWLIIVGLVFLWSKSKPIKLKRWLGCFFAVLISVWRSITSARLLNGFFRIIKTTFHFWVELFLLICYNGSCILSIYWMYKYHFAQLAIKLSTQWIHCWSINNFQLSFHEVYSLEIFFGLFWKLFVVFYFQSP